MYVKGKPNCAACSCRKDDAKEESKNLFREPLLEIIRIVKDGGSVSLLLPSKLVDDVSETLTSFDHLGYIVSISESSEETYQISGVKCVILNAQVEKALEAELQMYDRSAFIGPRFEPISVLPMSVILNVILTGIMIVITWISIKYWTDLEVPTNLPFRYQLVSMIIGIQSFHVLSCWIETEKLVEWLKSETLTFRSGSVVLLKRIFNYIMDVSVVNLVFWLPVTGCEELFRNRIPDFLIEIISTISTILFIVILVKLKDMCCKRSQTAEEEEYLLH